MYYVTGISMESTLALHIRPATLAVIGWCPLHSLPRNSSIRAPIEGIVNECPALINKAVVHSL
ncbi:hypothetical protein CsSME_00033498 [Camellia sinensis var. sinensis]